jgi:hypothetical protein
MGFKKNWEVSNITSQVHSLAREISSPYNDGFTQWNCKQDLYQIKQIIDETLAKSHNFGDLEEQWLLEQEKKHIIKILKS